MPKLVVLDHDFDMPAEAVAPLVAADILYWDTMGDSWPKEDHLHINPELPGFGALEVAVYRAGPSALPHAG